MNKFPGVAREFITLLGAAAVAQADEVMAPASAESEHRGSGVLRFPAPGGE